MVWCVQVPAVVAGALKEAGSEALYPSAMFLCVVEEGVWDARAICPWGPLVGIVRGIWVSAFLLTVARKRRRYLGAWCSTISLAFSYAPPPPPYRPSTAYAEYEKEACCVR